MEHRLTPMEIRVLGCLIEKKMATPDYYPLSLNALVNACNQKSNRNPVMAVDEGTVLAGIDMLTNRRMVFQSHLGRVIKYEETFLKENNFVPEESAILCVLLLRGAQTLGEIRVRTERLYLFDSLDHVNIIIDNLIVRNYVGRLDRQPGRKEVRYTHALGDRAEEIDFLADRSPDIHASENHTDDARIQALEEKLEAISVALTELKAQFLAFTTNKD